MSNDQPANTAPEDAGGPPPAPKPPPVAADRQTVPRPPADALERIERHARVDRLRRRRGHPTLAVAGTALAVFVLLGAVYFATGQWRRTPPSAPDVQDAEPDRGGPAVDAAPPQTAPPAEGRTPASDAVSQIQIALRGGDVDRAAELLDGVLQSGDTNQRTWARQLREQIDAAHSDRQARKLLDGFTDDQLRRIARGEIELQDGGFFGYAALRERFFETLRGNAQRLLDAGGPRTEPTGAADTTPVRAPAPDPESPQADRPASAGVGPSAVLKQRGLTHRGEYWTLDEDDDLQGVVEPLRRAQQSYAKADAAMREVAFRFRQSGGLRGAGPATALQMASPQYRETVLQYLNARSRFTLAYLAAARRVEQLRSAYAGLENDGAVQLALAQLDPATDQIGPTPTFRQNELAIGSYQGELMTDSTLGVFGDGRDAQVFHMQVIVCDRTSALLAYRPRAEYNLVPEAVLRDAGIEPAPGPERTLRIGGVPFRTSKVVIPSLRVGRCVSRDVEAYVLPSDVRRQGFLTDSAFSGYRIDIAPDTNWATLRPAR